MYRMLLYVSWARGVNVSSSSSCKSKSQNMEQRVLVVPNLFFHPPIINTYFWQHNKGSEHHYKDECDVNLTRNSRMKMLCRWKRDFQSRKPKQTNIMGLFTLTSSVHHGFFVVEIMLLKNNYEFLLRKIIFFFFSFLR